MSKWHTTSNINTELSAPNTPNGDNTVWLGSSSVTCPSTACASYCPPGTTCTYAAPEVRLYSNAPPPREPIDHGLVTIVVALLALIGWIVAVLTICSTYLDVRRLSYEPDTEQ